tara:strand:- start:1458 stop:2867 length:1410 start_codon:yes stop_codon:yes gene_type:complete
MKKKYIILLIVLLLVFITSGVYLISQDVSNKFSKRIKENTPYIVRQILGKTIFYVPLKIREFNLNEGRVKALKKKNLILKLKYLKYKNKTEIGLKNLKTIEGKKEKYFLQSYILPFFVDENIYDNDKKGYLDVINNKILIIFGSGKSILIDKDELNKGNFKFIELKNNILNADFFDSKKKWTGIKDIKIHNNKVFLSLTKNISTDCYNTSIFVSEFDNNLLNFSDILQTDQCINSKSGMKAFPSFKNYTGYQAGGRIDVYKSQIYLTVGDFNKWENPQDDKSIFGKVIKVSKKKGKYTIVSKGHRNQQGMHILDSGKMILTEHGPKGGDEINLIDIEKNIIKNFGWPIASYGNHYDSVPLNRYIKKIAPLKKSHIKNNFEEPIKYFMEGIGISQIIKNFYLEGNSFFVTSLKNKKIYNIIFDDNFKNPKILEEIKIGERIRDIIYDKDEKKYYLYLEDSPKIMLLSNFS